MTKVNREWEKDFSDKFAMKPDFDGKFVQHATYCKDITDFIDQLLSQTRKDLLREIMEEMPKKMKMKPAEDTGSEAGWGVVTGFNDYHDQVNTILERKLSTVKK